MFDQLFEIFGKMFTEKAFDNFYKVLPLSGESWLCIFVVMGVLIASVSLLGLIKSKN